MFQLVNVKNLHSISLIILFFLILKNPFLPFHCLHFHNKLKCIIFEWHIAHKVILCITTYIWEVQRFSKEIERIKTTMEEINE